jgi:TonB-dependent receptor
VDALIPQKILFRVFFLEVRVAPDKTFVMEDKQLYKRFCITVSIFFFLVAIPGLWSATITGRVYDEVNDIYLASARVSLMGTDVEAVTDRRGSYRIIGVEPGEYVALAQVSGRPSIRSEVVISADYDEKVINFTISEDDIIDLEEFVVEGSLIGTAKSLDIRRSAVNYREVIASDAFGQFTDRNPAEALQRVAGVTVESDQGEGSFILIRGGSPDLSNIQIDGVNLATPEEDGRQVNLNVITVDQLESIELSKTWLPSQNGNVISGTVNMITRSALDRGERYGSIEGAMTRREIYDDKDSWRYAVTYGDFFEKGDKEGLNWLSEDFAIGVQVSFNQSEDFLGSDTVTWGWIVDKDYPFLSDPGEDRPTGFTLDNLAKRNFNIDRERTGGSARFEVRFNKNHEIHASMSTNKFDDISREHIFDQNTQSLAQFYSGTTFLSLPVVEELGLDPNDPFVAKRLALGAPNFNAALTYNEAIQLGELEYDAERRLFTKGGLWGTAMRRYFNHRVKNDQIDTLNIGGEHTFLEDLKFDWKIYSSEASQNSDRYQLRFSIDGTDGDGVTGTGGFPLAGPGVQNPYILDASESPALFNKISSKMKEPTTPNVGSGILLHNIFESIDEREGYEGDLSKQFEVGDYIWTIAVGFAKDEREKSYKVNENDFGLAGIGSLDPAFWPNANRQASLDDEFFDGGEIEGFQDNFGDGLRFGPSFNEENTLAFMQDPESFGAVFDQNENHLNDNFTSRVRLNYDATEDVTAYYYQQTIDWKKWKFIFGARHEKTENTFINLEILTRNPELPPAIKFIRPGFWRLVARTEFGEDGFTNEAVNERKYDHFLPAFHIIREIGDNMVLRASATKTIARPKFTDLIPREIPSISGSNFGTTLQLPAFDLVPLESDNYDISLDYYIKPIGVFSVALFYKDLDGPIYEENRYEVGPNTETAVYAEKYTSKGLNTASWNLSQFRNSGKGEIQGLELTYNRQLNFLPSFLNGLGINSNISWFESEATLVTDLRVGEKVPLFKQPDMTGNFSLYYDKHGLFARLSYNYRGEYLNSITAGRGVLTAHEGLGIPANSRDEYVESTARIDFTMRYKITPSLQVFFEAINLTNEPVVRVIKHESLPVYKQYTERVFTIGVKWNL